MFRDTRVALARTVSARATRQAVREVEDLYLDLIAAAGSYIYIESQYFTAQALGDALALRLAEPEGPEVVVVTRVGSTGWLEAPTMTALRTVLLQKLRDADVHHRFHAWYPDTPGELCCDLHSKVMIVDDEWLRVGSANFANRSMGVDTECDLVLEARGDPLTRGAIASARNALLAEHLGVSAGEVEATLARTRSLGVTLETLAGNSTRTLRPFEHLDEPSLAVVALANGVADPERPVSMDELIAGFQSVVMRHRGTRRDALSHDS
jgi:phosphatidylserine/phosphatidylglycerophosphate/cardiolipin synthase-like enzyme